MLRTDCNNFETFGSPYCLLNVDTQNIKTPSNLCIFSKNINPLFLTSPLVSGAKEYNLKHSVTCCFIFTDNTTCRLTKCSRWKPFQAQPRRKKAIAIEEDEDDKREEEEKKLCQVDVM